MAWMKVFLIALCLNFGTLHGLDTRELSNEAVERGREWIWNQRDPLTDFWPRGEVITAIMGEFFQECIHNEAFFSLLSIQGIFSCIRR